MKKLFINFYLNKRQILEDSLTIIQCLLIDMSGL